MLTQETVKELLDYDPETGVFIWKHRGRKWFESDRIYNSWNTRCARKVSGTIGSRGYLKIDIKRITYQAHRLAWLYIYGDFPKDQIDHINHNKLDNRIINLRSVSQQENSKNSKLSKNNKSGFPGIYSYRYSSDKWVVQAKINGKEKHIGVFNSLDEAITAKKRINISNGYHPNHGRLSEDCSV